AGAGLPDPDGASPGADARSEGDSPPYDAALDGDAAPENDGAPDGEVGNDGGGAADRPELSPVPAAYDGDGRADFARWQRSTGTWTITLSSTGLNGTIVLG